MEATATVPDHEWQALLALYAGRADLARHRVAARRAAELAETWPEDRRLQLLAAMAAWYVTHRLKESAERKAVARRGRAAAQRLLDRDPRDYDARYWHALTTFREREADGIKGALAGAREARDYLETMVRDEPERHEAYMLLGVIYRELPPVVSFGDKKRAVRLLEEGARLAPTDPEMLLELAAAYRKAGRKDEAREAYRRVIEESQAPALREWETDDARTYARKMLKKRFF